jgi:hypothetical protein
MEWMEKKTKGARSSNKMSITLKDTNIKGIKF